MVFLPLYFHRRELRYEPAVAMSKPKIPINEAHCAQMAEVEWTNFIVSLIILIGLVLSYLPQHYRIIARRSSEGISPYFVLLGTTSASSALANILALPTSQEDFACCYVNSSFSCFAGLLGIAQITMQWICFFTILLLFIIYFPRATAFIPPETLKDRPSYRTALTVTFVAILHAIVLAIINITIGSMAPEYLQAYANVLGICAACLTSIQYFPQLWTTWKMGRVGSLSIPMMCIQTPGGFLWSASLAARLGWAGWSAWGIYLITATMQGILLIMGVIFEIQAWRRRKNGEVDSDNVSVSGETITDSERANERTALLQKDGQEN